MESLNYIPDYQPLPFPLPVWLMQTLLVAGFFLHALPMNVVWGGSIISAILFFLGRKDKNSYPIRAARALAVSLPLFISFAITQGIVPLLFLQLLYGPSFYTSSILIAAPWLGLLGVLMVAYYASYFVIYKVLKGDFNQGMAVKAACVLLFASIGFGVIGWLFSNNMTLMQAPQKWLSMYQASPHGLNLNSNESQLMPRYLHFFVASLAVTGMTIGCFGIYLKNKNEEFSKWLIKRGSQIFVGTTLLQIPVGLWFLRSIPPEYAAAFMGGDPAITAIFIASMALMILALLATAVSSTSGNKEAFICGLVLNALLIVAMIINRHQLRMLYLNPYVKPDIVAVSTQLDLLAIFLVSTVALIGYLVWLSKLVLSAFSSNVEPDSRGSEKVLSAVSE